MKTTKILQQIINFYKYVSNYDIHYLFFIKLKTAVFCFQNNEIIAIILYEYIFEENEYVIIKCPLIIKLENYQAGE